MNRTRLSWGGIAALSAYPAGRSRRRLQSPNTRVGSTSAFPEKLARIVVGSEASTTSILSTLAGTAVALVSCRSYATWYLPSVPRNGRGGSPIGVTVIAVNASGTVTPATVPAGCAAVLPAVLLAVPAEAGSVAEPDEHPAATSATPAKSEATSTGTR